MIVFCTMLLFMLMTGCSSAEKENLAEDSIEEADSEYVFEETHTYVGETARSYFFAPKLRLDEARQTFLLESDHYSSNLIMGKYEIQDGILVAETEDERGIYQFAVVDDETLEFVQEGSSEIWVREGKSRVSLEDGTLFQLKDVENRRTLKRVS